MAETIIDTGERIRQKAHDLFMQYGLRSVSMDDIATQLGISKKTIYQYYADKDELVDAVVNGVLGTTESACEFDRNRADNAIHEIFLAMDMTMELFRSMNPSLLFDMQKYHPKAFQRFYKHKNDYLYGLIRENILRGIREEWYRTDLNVDVIARFRVESMLLPFHPDFHTKIKTNLALVEEELILFYLFGLVSQKGYKLILKYQQDRQKKYSDATK